MEKLSMRKIKEILRLKFELDLSARQIAKSLKVSRPTVNDYLRRFALTCLPWPLPSGLSEVDINTRLFPPKSAIPASLRAIPDWTQVNQEMRRKGATLFLLWQEYKAGQPDGFLYSWFCVHYREWLGKLDFKRANRAMQTDAQKARQTAPNPIHLGKASNRL